MHPVHRAAILTAGCIHAFALILWRNQIARPEIVCYTDLTKEEGGDVRGRFYIGKAAWRQNARKEWKSYTEVPEATRE